MDTAIWMRVICSWRMNFFTGVRNNICLAQARPAQPSSPHLNPFQPSKPRPDVSYSFSTPLIFRWYTHSTA